MAPRFQDNCGQSPGAHMNWSALAQLIRLPNQSGTLLLLWPSWWALWFACRGMPPLQLLLIFGLGAFLMRSAGVILNDLADRRFDRHVARTRERPLAAGTLTVGHALLALTTLLAAAAGLLAFLPPLAWSLSPVAVALAAGYPLAKRYLAIPQAILGIAFGWGVVMAWASVHERIDAPAWLLLFGTMCWAMAYDTIYALQDQEDDRRIGVKSSALFFGSSAWIAVLICDALLLVSLAGCGWMTAAGSWFYASLMVVGAFLCLQAFRVRTPPDPSVAFRLFKEHVWVGLAILMGIALGFA